MFEGSPSPLPPLFAPWIEDLLGAPLPVEQRATCGSCAMLPGNGGDDETPRFNPAVRCCTFMPELVNFHAGMLLATSGPESAEGRGIVEARIAAMRGVSLLGIERTPEYASADRPGARVFGQTVAHRCPYLLDDARCAVWRFRPSPCSTWYCRHDRGAVGWRFWRGLQDLLFNIERSLGWWCLLELDVGDEAMNDLLFKRGPEAELGVGPPASWGNWAGRSREFYLRCAELVRPLGWERVLDICGEGVEELAKRLRGLHGRLASDAVPPALAAGSYELVQIGPKTTHVRSYSKYDLLALPTELLEALPRFDGGSPLAAIRAIAAERKLAIDARTLRTLVDWELLVPPRKDAARDVPEK